MARIEKTIFISYRRTDVYTALAVYDRLMSQGYDVFFDYTSIPSGDFEQIIISNIKARAHFIVILTPTTLDRCSEPDDWLRREIETAIDEKRNIIPLFFKGFKFGSPAVSEKLTGKLGNIRRYNGMNVHEDYFHEAMDRLCEKFLNTPLEAVLHPVSTEVQRVVKKEQIAANQAVLQKEELDNLAQKQLIHKQPPEAVRQAVQDVSPRRQTQENVQHPRKELTSEKKIASSPRVTIGGFNFNYSTSDLMIMAVIGATAGLINTWMGNVWNAANTINPIFGAALQGAFMWAYLLAYFLVRKSGSMLIIGVIEAAVEALLGNQAGLNTIGWGITQGFGAEFVMWFTNYRKFGWLVFGLAGAAASQIGTFWSFYLYGWSSFQDYLIAIPLNLISGFFLSGLLGLWVGKLFKPISPTKT